MEQYAKIQQILKKEEGQKERKPIYPPTVIQAVFDAKTGASLEAILAQFNSIYVQYQGTPQATRCIIPKEMRRAGLTITYMNMDSETITERAASAVQKDNDHWGLDINWSRVDELSLSGDISVSAQGTWIINGEDTGVKALGPKGDAGLTPWLKTIDNRLHFSYDNVNWEPCSEPIAAYFRFNATSGNTQSGTIGKIQISRDNKTWNDLSPEFTNNLHIAGYVATTSALPANKPVGTIYGVGPTYAAEDTTQTNPIYRIYVYNGTTWVDNGQFTSIAAGIVQETGDSETEVMSQKATTEKLTELARDMYKNVFELIDERELTTNAVRFVKDGNFYTFKNGEEYILIIKPTETKSVELFLGTSSSYSGIAQSLGTFDFSNGIEKIISIVCGVENCQYIYGNCGGGSIFTLIHKEVLVNKETERAISEEAKLNSMILEETNRAISEENLIKSSISKRIYNQIGDTEFSSYVSRIVLGTNSWYTFIKDKMYKFILSPKVSGECTISLSTSSSASDIKQTIGTFDFIEGENVEIEFTCEVEDCQYIRAQISGVAGTTLTVSEFYEASLTEQIENLNDKFEAEINESIGDFWDLSRMSAIIVKKDGTGDFETIQDAINSVNDSSKRNIYDIQVYDDFESSDISDLWILPSIIASNIEQKVSSYDDIVNFHTALVITKNWIVIRGIGEKKKLSFKSPEDLPEEAFQHIQTIYAMGNFKLINFEVTIEGGRYPVHQESGGNDNSLDFDAHSFYESCTFIHEGNAHYINNGWSSSLAFGLGTCSGFKADWIDCTFISKESDNIMAGHSNYISSSSSWLFGNKFRYVRCKALKQSLGSLKLCNLGFEDLGSGKKHEVYFECCSIPKYNSVKNTERGYASSLSYPSRNYWNGGVELKGFGNSKIPVSRMIPDVLCFKTINGGEIDVVGGSAINDVWGHTYKKANGICFGSERVIFDDKVSPRYIYTLGWRLGDCLLSNKTLIVRVDDVDYEIIFNKNYITEDGSSYTSVTKPVIDTLSILQDINNAHPSVFKAELCESTIKLDTFDDCKVLGINGENKQMVIGDAVCFDYSTQTWKFAENGQEVDGIVGEIIDGNEGVTYSTGIITIARKNLYSVADLGIGDSTVKGSLYKWDGEKWLLTTERSEAIFIAIDDYYLDLALSR